MIFSRVSKSFDIITQKIQQAGEISPFLFCSEQTQLLHSDLEQALLLIQSEFWLDKSSIFTLFDTGESLKIEEVKRFMQAAEVRSRLAFQVFYIEGLSRMTPQAQNACLKFFEEPGQGNIIILSDRSQAGILETILSRVSCYTLFQNQTLPKNDFFHSLILSHRSRSSEELIRYFFSAKLEKQEYVDFLQTLLRYYMENWQYLEQLDELQEDISGILKNNLQGKYVVDKWILRL